MIANYWINYPTEYKKQIKPLLHQQMWLFGQDILCPEGNLLYQYQFTHQPAEERGASMYTRCDGDKQIVLWGWGIWFGQTGTGAIFVNRYKAKPQFTAVAVLNQTVHQPEELPRLTYRVGSEAEAETTRQLWRDLLSWIAAYEAWVLETAGLTWRRAAVKLFNHAITKSKDVGQLPTQWWALAEQSQMLPIKSYMKKD